MSNKKYWQMERKAKLTFLRRRPPEEDVEGPTSFLKSQIIRGVINLIWLLFFRINSVNMSG